MFDNTFLISLIGFLVILTPLVFIHELGHYLTAIKNGVIVEQFSVGFGPELIGFTDKHNTRWKVCLIPFGGYVKMKGELLVNNENYKNNYYLNNLDINIICEQPKISKIKNKIIDKISSITELDKNRINVKGKTAEKLGIIGNQKAIASEVIVSLIKYD